MPLRPPRQTLRAQTLASRLLADLAAGDAAGEGARGSMLLVPMRTLRLDDLERAPLAPSWQIGWRAYWVGAAETEGATVELLRTRGGRPRFSSYSWGAKAVAFANMSRRAEAAVADLDASYQIAILRLSVLRMEAVWLRSAKARSTRLFGLMPELDDRDFIDEALLRRDRQRTPDAGR